MNRIRRRFSVLRVGARTALQAVALVALLGACGRREKFPVPPSSPPRPLTSVHKHIDSAILNVHKLPGHPRRGMM